MTGPERCAEPGCEVPWFSRGLCKSHYGRHWRNGSLGRYPKRAAPGGPSYFHAHKVLRQLRGVAADQVCYDCGEVAAEWSYQGGASDEMLSPEGHIYTYEPNAYVPRCLSCHRRRDRAVEFCPRGHCFAEVGRDTQRKCRACGRERAAERARRNR